MSAILKCICTRLVTHAFSVPKLSFGWGVRGGYYPPKRGRGWKLLVRLDTKRVRKDQ